MTVGSNEKKYDVAISFLVQDLALAQAIRDKLSEGLEVFFFPHNQEELAGTDGLESMREPFLHESRVNLVLYREKWGNTPWTRVEATAIKEACLEQGWEGLFFFMIEPKDAPPKWLPRTHVRLNYGDFSLDQAVGAIKARVREQGGRFVPMTPTKRAQILQAEDDYRSAKSRINSYEGLSATLANTKQLLSEIARQCSELSSGGRLSIETEIDLRAQQAIVIRNQDVGMIVTWQQPYANSLQRSGLYVREYNSQLLFTSELSHRMYMRQPEQIKETKYEPELSRSLELGWSAARNQVEFISTQALAEKCVIEFLDLIERSNAGKIRRPEW
jgi:hypothetical protein